jgi:4-hydroxy-tetrahydrodipicolinate synthase
MSNTAPARLRGVLAPVLTPFHHDLEPNVKAFVAHCRWLISQGVGLAIFGTNSEANSLSVAERLALTDALIEAGIDPACMMPGSGCCSIKDTVALTRHAVNAGAAGVLMLPPFFYKNVSEDGIFAFYSEVIDAIGDARLAVYLYHIPALSAVPISVSLVERLRKRYPATVVGLKDSSGDWDNTRTMIETFGQDGFDVFPASEVFLSEALALGGAGCISATANVNPAMLDALYRQSDDPACTELKERAKAIRSAFQSQPMIPAMKHVLAHRYRDASWHNVRPPLMPFNQVNASQFGDALRKIGFPLELQASLGSGEEFSIRQN